MNSKADFEPDSKIYRVIVHDYTQYFLAFLLIINYALLVLEADFGMETKSYLDILLWIFAVEIVIKIIFGGALPFFKNGWDITDFVLIGIGVIMFFGFEIHEAAVGARAARVLRLLTILDATKKILGALIHAMARVSVAFFILIVVVAVWGLIARMTFVDPNLAHLYGNTWTSIGTFLQITVFDSVTVVVKETASVYFWPTFVILGSYFIIVPATLFSLIIGIVTDVYSELGEEANSEEGIELEAMLAMQRALLRKVEDLGGDIDEIKEAMVMANSPMR